MFPEIKIKVLLTYLIKHSTNLVDISTIPHAVIKKASFTLARLQHKVSDVEEHRDVSFGCAVFW